MTCSESVSANLVSLDRFAELDRLTECHEEKLHGQAFGKVMLFGEYAVIEGESALLSATPHRAHARFFSFDSLQSVAELDSELKRLIEQAYSECFQFEYIIFAYQLGSSLIKGQKRIGASFPFAEYCLKDQEAPKGIYLIDTRQFGLDINGQWNKMGIGSSGASTVALCELLAHLLKRPKLQKPYERFLYVQQVHRIVQGGMGSGADVACSSFGGLIEFRPSLSPQDEQKSRYQVQVLEAKIPRTWALWKGGSHSTTQSLKAFKLWKHEQPKAYNMMIRELGALSHQACLLLKSEQHETSKQEEWCRLIKHGGLIINSLSKQLGQPLWTKSHQQWSELIKQKGGAIKSTGAGGDDLTLFTADHIAAERECLDLIHKECERQGQKLHCFLLSTS